MNASQHPRSVASLAVVGAACIASMVLAFTAGPMPASAGEGVGDPSAEPSGLFVHRGGERWSQPLAVYPQAALRRLGVPPAVALRLPSALAGALTIVLTAVLATRVIPGVWVCAAAAILLLGMPGFRLYSRAPEAELLVVPLLLTWLMAVLLYLERPRWWLPLIAGAALGMCVYTQPSGVLAVDVFFVMGALVLCRTPGGTAALLSSAAAIGVVLVPAAVWVVLHPEAYQDTFGRWAIHAAHVRNPWDGLVAFSHWHVMARRVGEYWGYLNPTFLFGRELLGWPLALLVPLGLVQMRRPLTSARALTVAGLFAAPVAGVLLDVPRTAAFALPCLAFGAVLAAAAIAAIKDLSPRRRV
jgi:4-amino-4-deoxy-L-arabinose transferase-like glycosyltransferase